MRDPEPGNNVFPDKLLGVHVPDVYQGFSLNLFSKIISADQQIPLVSHGLEERANYI